MLSSTGPMWERGNGGVGYFARDQECNSTTCPTPCVSFLERALSAPNVTTIPLIVGPKNSFTKWLPLPKVPGIFVAEEPRTNTFGRLARQEQRRLEQNDDPNSAAGSKCNSRRRGYRSGRIGKLGQGDSSSQRLSIRQCPSR